jgi:hypothetical protein
MTKKSKKSLLCIETRKSQLRAQGDAWLRSYMESVSLALVGGQIKEVKFNSELKPPKGEVIPLTEMYSLTITMSDGSEVIVTPSFANRNGRAPKSYGGLMVMKISSHNVKVHTPLPATASDETGVKP